MTTKKHGLPLKFFVKKISFSFIIKMDNILDRLIFHSLTHQTTNPDHEFHWV
jgi:predicted aminopeptidase